MLKRLLSPRGYKTYWVTTIGLAGYVLWMGFTSSGVVGWLDRFEAHYLFSGYYYPELSMLILVVPIGIVCLVIGLAHDSITGTGVFANRDQAEDDPSPTTPQTAIRYRETIRKELIDQVRTSHWENIRQLKLLEFEELSFYSETVLWFGISAGLMGLTGALGLLANEVTRIGKSLSVQAFFIVMVSREKSVYATTTRLGVKFYTFFTDGTCLITCNYRGLDFKSDNEQIYWSSGPSSISAALIQHLERVKRLQAAGKATSMHVSFAEYADFNTQIDRFMQKNPTKLQNASATEPSLMATMISSAVSSAIFIGCVVAALFLVNLSASFYPACVGLWNLRSIPLALNFLAFPLCFGVSWCLARFQNTLFTMDGMGTQLYGRDPVPNSTAYISTKWLVLPRVPLIPVRSYLVTGEQVQALTRRRVFILEPLDRIHWQQVKATLRRSRIGYGVLTMIGFALVVVVIVGCR